ncbi:DUF1906 domain-containing protein [Streptomyces sp. NPDC057638]|uniref:DUF1906 domain-containing protein n=1 Tax=Streptomyces sp. NPDC057638 TaxID=3346190 RepID=UPI0036876834
MRFRRRGRRGGGRDDHGPRPTGPGPDSTGPSPLGPTRAADPSAGPTDPGRTPSTPSTSPGHGSTDPGHTPSTPSTSPSTPDTLTPHHSGGRARHHRLPVAAALAVTALIALPDLLLTGPPTGPAPTAVDRSLLPVVPDTTADTAVTFRGLVFDACQAPPLAAMTAWRGASPYGAVGVTYAGRGRDCPGQPHLTRRWVSEVHRMGWRVLPVYAGSQPPCLRAEPAGPPHPARREATPHPRGTTRLDHTNPRNDDTSGRDPLAPHQRHAVIGATPAAQGEREGAEAVTRGRALGMGPGSALYLSLKSYDLRVAACVRATLDFVRAWDREVRRRGYVPGLRSHADAGVLHMERARRAGTGDLPSALWFTRSASRPSLYEERTLHPYAWRVKRRIHQYAAPAAEQYGGHALTVGRSLADAPVARIERTR